MLIQAGRAWGSVVGVMDCGAMGPFLGGQIGAWRQRSVLLVGGWMGDQCDDLTRKNTWQRQAHSLLLCSGLPW